MAPTLVSSGGVPIPPAAVVRRLAELSDRFKVEWIAGAHVPYWGLKVRWAHDDPRWERVRSGEVPPHMAFDLEQMFPKDCSADEMAAYVEQRWGDRNRLTKGEATKEANRVVDQDARAQSETFESNVQRVAHESNERSAKESAHLKRVRAGAEDAHPMVPGGLTP